MTTRLASPALMMTCLWCTCACTTTIRTAHLPSEQSVPAVMRRQVLNAVDAGDGDYQVRALRSRMIAEPENVAVRLDLAARYEQLGYPELAVEHCRLAAARFPGNVDVRVMLATSLRRAGHPRVAAEGLEEFLKTHPPSSPQPASWLGIILDELEEHRRAESAHRQALVLGPGQDSLHNNLGYNLLLQGRRPEAVEHFRAALKANPNSEFARNNLGMAVADSPPEAVAHWKSVTDPATAHNNLAAVLIEEGRYREARRELETALGYHRDHAAALANLKLVSELDGQPAAFRWSSSPESIWRKLGRVIVGSEAPRKAPADSVRTASSGVNEEEEE